MFITSAEIFTSVNLNLGVENYENQLKYGSEVFQELNDLQRTGYVFDGYHHEIKIVCCSDWKARACLEGLNCFFHYSNYIHILRKLD